jgi:hypothetical protein
MSEVELYKYQNLAIHRLQQKTYDVETLMIPFYRHEKGNQQTFGLSFPYLYPLFQYIALLTTVTMMKTAAILASILGSVAAFAPAQTGTCS